MPEVAPKTYAGKLLPSPLPPKKTTTKNNNETDSCMATAGSCASSKFIIYPIGFTTSPILKLLNKLLLQQFRQIVLLKTSVLYNMFENTVAENRWSYNIITVVNALTVSIKKNKVAKKINDGCEKN